MKKNRMRRERQSARRRRGFTLMEVIVVLAVTAIVGAIAVPAAMASLKGLEARQCQGSREAIYTYYVMQKKLTGSTKTLEECIAFYTDATAAGDSFIEPCPSGGTYTADSDGTPTHVVCSVHGS